MIHIIDFGSSKTGQIKSCVEPFYSCTIIQERDYAEKNAQESSGIILSGAPILLSQIDNSLYLARFEWLKSYEKPILGICFGHQLMGLLHGASIALQKEDREMQWIEVIAQNPLWDDIENPVLMQEDHTESISIPRNFVLSATSDPTVNETMHHESKPHFGVQFHPEVSGPAGERLLENFCKVVQIFKAQ
jgi:GMP synthase (glutamine-hydrolysing)